MGDLYELSLGSYNFELLVKNLTELRELHLYSVNISSTIPSNLSSHLTILQLSNTQLHVISPKRVLHLSNLESLNLSYNPQLTVRFPTTKWNSSASLMELYLHGENITEFHSYPKTLLWNKSTNCCSWEGVYCDKTTGQVIELNLTCSGLQGNFHSNSSLFQLYNLKRLDLSYNNFSGSLISPKFGEFSSLTYLDLSRSSFSGQIPYEISYLSKLYVLRIWTVDPYGLRLGRHNFEQLLKNLTQLRELNLDFVNISSTIPLNFSSHLTTFQLSDTQLCGILPERVFHLSDLESLELSSNPQLTFRFPTAKWNSSTSLMKLFLDGVNIIGKIPESFSHLTSLHYLDMSYSNLLGPILKPLWNLTNIEFLFLVHNHLEGPISQFLILGNLKYLLLRNNNFDGRFECLSLNRSWTQLEILDFSSNFLTGPIPSNISGLQNLQWLYLSSNNLNGTIPSWIFSLPSLTIEDQALALLQIKHMFSINPDASDYCDFFTRIQSYPKTLLWNKSTDCCSWGRSSQLDLCYSTLQGKFHSNSSLFQFSNLKRLDLSCNNFTGSIISPKFGEFSSLTHLDLSGTGFAGLMPTEISHLSKLHVLRFSGLYELSLGPHNFELLLKNLTQLRELNLDYVNISSTIPQNFSSYLKNLRLPYTDLCGVLPERVFHLSDLEFLDLSSNSQLTVRFPTTKWNSTASLMYLRLYDVNITDRIPESFSHLTSLLVLDMSDCNLSGSITKPLWNLTNIEFLDLGNNHLKGQISLFSRVGKLKELSLRNNNFDGQLEFNRSWMQLESLQISSNYLTGSIPSNGSGLQNLQWLDLSSNDLNGTIPFWIFSLSSLEVLDLSNNSFSGKIQEFKSKTLSIVTLKQNQLQDQEEEEDSPMISWQAVLMGYCCGLVIGLSVIYIMLSTQYPTWFSRIHVYRVSEDADKSLYFS
ncbi:hypothetical protein H5410_000175 [Solanum commersonii]|uniref:Leucine-rich repeat-containing N-terminal plant-type domain-containing protein n=1 Tax=Solanum commersonii TaxID=4109 RepID=A0A9J6AW23_SOLCO|nr:hypothetical protein H5410_000175 [Solanum commersonii]